MPLLGLMQAREAAPYSGVHPNRRPVGPGCRPAALLCVQPWQRALRQLAHLWLGCRRQGARQHQHAVRLRRRRRRGGRADRRAASCLSVARWRLLGVRRPSFGRCARCCRPPRRRRRRHCCCCRHSCCSCHRRRRWYRCCSCCRSRHRCCCRRSHHRHCCCGHNCHCLAGRCHRRGPKQVGQ